MGKLFDSWPSVIVLCTCIPYSLIFCIMPEEANDVTSGAFLGDLSAIRPLIVIILDYTIPKILDSSDSSRRRW